MDMQIHKVLEKTGLIGVIGIAFLLLFKFKLKPPKKKRLKIL